LVDDHEWDEVTDYLFKNQEYFTAVSLLPKIGDKIYSQAPLEAVLTEEDLKKWNDLYDNWTPVPYTKLSELDDETIHTSEAACAGGNCEVKAL
jgi:CRISPR/Cas system CSM-associated protein Csm4 (group 5 of RAMP superfamily)